MASDPNETNNDARPGEDDVLRYATSYHAPVLWHTVVEDLITDRDGVYVDGTLGGGGHAAAILDELSPEGRLIGIDRDPAALDTVRARLPEEIEANRLTLVRGAFGEFAAHLDALEIEQVNGLLLDLGISSHQIDVPERGFSYASEGRLDMRMNPETGLSAHDIVNEWSERDFAQVLFDFGEEPAARRIARSIVRDRPIETTRELANSVRSAVPVRDEVKSLSRVFQAIRIAVNEELGELERALMSAENRIVIGGRIVVISYHSLEDRRVKRFLRTGNFAGRAERDVFGNRLVGWRELHRKPIEASEAERTRNPRSRSARLRTAERVAVPGQ